MSRCKSPYSCHYEYITSRLSQYVGSFNDEGFKVQAAGNSRGARRRYVVKHNLITEVYLMTVMETTTCFGLCWPSSGCLGTLRASYMHAYS